MRPEFHPNLSRFLCSYVVQNSQPPDSSFVLCSLGKDQKLIPPVVLCLSACPAVASVHRTLGTGGPTTVPSSQFCLSLTAAHSRALNTPGVPQTPVPKRPGSDEVEAGGVGGSQVSPRGGAVLMLVWTLGRARGQGGRVGHAEEGHCLPEPLSPSRCLSPCVTFQ